MSFLVLYKIWFSLPLTRQNWHKRIIQNIIIFTLWTWEIPFAWNPFVIESPGMATSFLPPLLWYAGPGDSYRGCNFPSPSSAPSSRLLLSSKHPPGVPTWANHVLGSSLSRLWHLPYKDWNRSFALPGEKDETYPFLKIQKKI